MMIYYDLLEERDILNTKEIAIVRLEQLFPLDIVRIKKIIDKYNPKKLFWVQEEPENMGAWSFILSQLKQMNIQLISRDLSAATATGSSKRSLKEQKEIINKVFK